MVQRHKASDCLRPPLVNELPDKCQQLKRGYGECKRGMIDMRKRFRGNWPVIGTGDNTGSGQPHEQLYAGKPALSTIPAKSEAEKEGDEKNE